MKSSDPVHYTDLPDFQGRQWLKFGEFPEQMEDWYLGEKKSVDSLLCDPQAMKSTMRQAIQYGDWQWPAFPIYFISDVHADTDAFLASLVASGGIKKTGPKDKDIELTKEGRAALFVIGGDCFDKGPDNLRLLCCIRYLDSIAKVVILAGNHDLRLFLGIRSVFMRKDPRTEHFFVRMGAKAVPLLKEVYDNYLDNKASLNGIPDNESCREILYPSEKWFEEFPRIAQWSMSSPAVKRETSRIRKKIDKFEDNCTEAGLSLRKVFATVCKCRELFLEGDGEYAWFYRKMKLMHRETSFLFLHAGLDDSIAAMLDESGIDQVNDLFRQQLNGDLFKFYYGSVANTIRTKYREVDMPLSKYGVDKVQRMGIHALVHGHRNLYNGQRIMLRSGLLHIESDTTMDCNSRIKEGLQGLGAGVTIISPNKKIIGISADYPYAKVFTPGNSEF